MTNEPEVTEPENNSTLVELFSRDPLKLAEQDIDKIIESMRSARHTFLRTGKSPSKPRATRPVSKAKAEVLGLDLDLDLKL